MAIMQIWKAMEGGREGCVLQGQVSRFSGHMAREGEAKSVGGSQFIICIYAR